MDFVTRRKATDIFIEEVDICGTKHFRGLVLNYISF